MTRMTNENLLNEIHRLMLDRRDISQDERSVGWEKIAKMADGDKHWLAKIDMAKKHYDEIDFPFKGKVPSWAAEGKDYIIIPDGTRYRSLDINIDRPEPDGYGRYNYEEWRHKKAPLIYDYKEEGLVPGEPRAEYNGGSGMIFDGKDVLLTCNFELYNYIKAAVGAKNGGMYNHFFVSKQYGSFDDVDMDRQFSSVICHAEGPHRVPDKEAKMRTLIYQFYEKLGVRDPAVPMGSYTGIWFGSYEQRNSDLLLKFSEYDKEQKAISMIDMEESKKILHTFEKDDKLRRVSGDSLCTLYYFLPSILAKNPELTQDAFDVWKKAIEHPKNTRYSIEDTYSSLENVVLNNEKHAPQVLEIYQKALVSKENDFGTLCGAEGTMLAIVQADPKLAQKATKAFIKALDDYEDRITPKTPLKKFLHHLSDRGGESAERKKYIDQMRERTQKLSALSSAGLLTTDYAKSLYSR